MVRGGRFGDGTGGAQARGGDVAVEVDEVGGVDAGREVQGHGGEDVRGELTHEGLALVVHAGELTFQPLDGLEIVCQYECE